MGRGWDWWETCDTSRVLRTRIGEEVEEEDEDMICRGGVRCWLCCCAVRVSRVELPGLLDSNGSRGGVDPAQAFGKSSVSLSG